MERNSLNTQDSKRWIKSIALKVGSVILIIVAFIFIKSMGFLGGSVAESYMESNNEDRVIQILSDNIDDIRAQLPMVVDEITTLEQVDLDGTQIIYKYKVDLSGFDTSQISTIGSNIKNENINEGCNKPDISDVLDAGVKYHYSYYDLDNNQISSFEITRAICDNFQYQPSKPL